MFIRLPKTSEKNFKTIAKIKPIGAYLYRNRSNPAIVQYIISKGINPTRIDGKGFGETELKVNCNDTCTEEEHAQNRRSEFLIVK